MIATVAAVLALLWVGSTLTALVLLLGVCVADEMRIRRDARRMWQQVRELQR